MPEHDNRPRYRRWRVVLGGLALTVAVSGTVVSSDVPEVAAQPTVQASCDLEGCFMKFPDEQGCFDDRLEQTRTEIDWQITDGPEIGERYMYGNMVVYYSPGCRAAFVQYEMSIVRHGDFFPAVWIQPKYGGRSWVLGPPEDVFAVVSGGEENLGPAVVRTVLVPWDRSMRPCLSISSFDHDPDYPRDPGGMWSGVQCMTSWQ